jgi:outer membrane protein
VDYGTPFKNMRLVMAKRRIGSLFVIAGLLLTSASAQEANQTAQDPLPLSLSRAVEIALAPDGNTRAALALELVEQARERGTQSRAALLPNVGGSVSEQSIVRNLDAFGISLRSPIPGLSIPTIVGPFHVFDARVTATQTIFDLSAIRRYQGARTQAAAAQEERADAQSSTTADVARAYFSAVLAQQQQTAAQADVELSEELTRVAQQRNDAGTGIRIEVARADVELADRRQKLLAAETNGRAAQMQLARLLGLSLERGFELTTPLEKQNSTEPSLDGALEAALEHRADWRAQSLHDKAARRGYSAAKWERLPSLTAFGDYGTIGTSVGGAHPTRTVGASLQLPLFDGGRRDALRAEGASQLREESIRTRDLRRQIELELRTSLDALASAAMQAEVAESGLELAQEETSRASRRYEAGVGASLEVTDAQTRLARARQNQLNALALYNFARIDWFEARGQIEMVIP